VIDPDFVAYCEHLEHEFFRLKGRVGTLSPADFARARTWFDAGITLDAALEGIASAFRAQSAGRNRDAEEVNSLAFCESFVEQAMTRRRLL
jgi:hypothetical protein